MCVTRVLTLTVEGVANAMPGDDFKGNSNAVGSLLSCFEEFLGFHYSKTYRISNFLP